MWIFHLFSMFQQKRQEKSVFLRAIKNDGWDEVIQAVKASEALLKATLSMDERAVG